MMAQTQNTSSMMAHAAALLAEPRWARGVRNRDGRPVFLFASRSTGSVCYFADVEACSCPSYNFRGLCAHVVAVRERDEAEARENGLATLAEVDCHLGGMQADVQARDAARRRSELLGRLFNGED
jgi:hypothetical protein